MHLRTKHLVILCALAACFAAASFGQACAAQGEGQNNALEKSWGKFYGKIFPFSQNDNLRKIWEGYAGKTAQPQPRIEKYPGRLVGSDPTLAAFWNDSGWKYRASSYELYFASSASLARSVYGLAIQSGDVDATMPLERFEKGVRGFHYSAQQVCGWINAVFAERMPVYTDEEHRLIFWLLKDGVVHVVDGRAIPGTSIRHVLGAAPGTKRGFEPTLIHERLHVLWDEDPSFATEFKAKWDGLSTEEKQAARQGLAAYSQSNEAQLIEEWAVKQAESMPPEQRRTLVGL